MEEVKFPATAPPGTYNPVFHKYCCNKCTGFPRYFLSFKSLSIHLQEEHGNDKPSPEGERVPQFDSNELKDALERLSLTSVNVGDHIIVLNKNFDIMKDGEPYLSFMLIYNTKSGHCLERIWNQTMASSKIADFQQFLQLCMTHFNQGKLCPGYIENQKLGQNYMASSCHLLLPKDSGKIVGLCPACERVHDERKLDIFSAGKMKEEADDGELNSSDLEKLPIVMRNGAMPITKRW